MLNILIIIGWLLAICLMLYLAKELAKDRFRARRERKLAIRNAIRAKRREQFMENRRRWAEINTGVIQPRPAEAAAYAERRQKQNQRLPYFFLFIVMVVIPYSVYRFSTRRRRLARRASDKTLQSANSR